MRTAIRNLATTGRGIVTRRLLREDSKKRPRKDGEGYSDTEIAGELRIKN
ncbi:MAG: hypothetical protein FWG98_14965 [Candidatus Cloacimonetes bacterium]|nr:hypothetical protein [Candidatus Cloacimonadota bacterium]